MKDRQEDFDIVSGNEKGRPSVPSEGGLVLPFFFGILPGLIISLRPDAVAQAGGGWIHQDADQAQEGQDLVDDMPFLLFSSERSRMSRPLGENRLQRIPRLIRGCRFLYKAFPGYGFSDILNAKGVHQYDDSGSNRCPAFCQSLSG